MPAKTMPSEASRVSVHVVLRERMSISPDCSAAKRCCELSGTNLTFSPLPSTAAATARHMSTSRPCQRPLLSVDENPGADVLTPQTTSPRALTASSVLPAWAGGASDKTSAVAATSGTRA